MAVDGDVPQQDLKAHERTYDGFTVFMKWGTIATIVTVAIILWIIVG